MTETLAQVIDRVEQQRERVPTIYGAVDLAIRPERFAGNKDDLSELPDSLAARRTVLLADADRVERFRAFTMLGDPTADAYAALTGQYGFKRMVEMVDVACRNGISAVPDAPPELGQLLAEMEKAADLIDLSLAREAIEPDRKLFVLVAPYAVRGSFFGTFVNRYSALPMAATGALSRETASRRVRETVGWYASTLLPGGLERNGVGFHATAMVRVMHAMVRCNLLRRPDGWDIPVYGIPIPQIDSLRTGMEASYDLAKKVLRQGRTSFNRHERAQVELARYRCALLGIPVGLTGSDPQEIVDIQEMRLATLRKGTDEKTASLMRATMEADIAFTRSQKWKISRAMEHGFGRVMLVKQYLKGDAAWATELGVTLTTADYAWATITAIWIGTQMAVYALADRVWPLSAWSKRSVLRRLQTLTAAYGRGDFATDSNAYHGTRPATA